MCPDIHGRAGYRRGKRDPRLIGISFVFYVIGTINHGVVQAVGMILSSTSGHQHHFREGDAYAFAKVNKIMPQACCLLLQVTKGGNISVKQGLGNVMFVNLPSPLFVRSDDFRCQCACVNEGVGVDQEQGGAVRGAIEGLAVGAVGFLVVHLDTHRAGLALVGSHYGRRGVQIIHTCRNGGLNTVDVDLQALDRIAALDLNLYGVTHFDASAGQLVAGHGDALNQVTCLITGAPDAQLTELVEVLDGIGQYIGILGSLLEAQIAELCVVVLRFHVHGLVALLIGSFGNCKLCPAHPVVGTVNLHTGQAVGESGPGLEPELVHGDFVVRAKVHDAALVLHQPKSHKSTRFGIQPGGGITTSKGGAVAQVHIAEVQGGAACLNVHRSKGVVQQGRGDQLQLGNGIVELIEQGGKVPVRKTGIVKCRIDLGQSLVIDLFAGGRVDSTGVNSACSGLDSTGTVRADGHIDLL